MDRRSDRPAELERLVRQEGDRLYRAALAILNGDPADQQAEILAEQIRSGS